MLVAEADRRICLGNIEYHYFAGYSGGAKAIMPEVSSRAAIQANHSKMIMETAKAGEIISNPIRTDIEDVANFINIDFILNVVLAVEYVKVSGGIFLDMAIHDFDMARYLSGSEVTEVYTAGAVLVDPAIGEAGDVDTAVITLKFANGAIGVIDNSRKAAYGYDQRVEVFGSKGCVVVSNDTPNSTVLSTAEGVFSEKPKYFFLERYKDSFIDELKEFFNCIINDKQPSVSGIDGLKPVLIGLAAKESQQTGKPVLVPSV